jgi:hypothetical protein
MNAEYCLLWIDHWTTCLQKSEWASWIQALGAIAAIIGAVWVSHRQERRQRMHEKQVAVKKSRNFGASVEGFAEQLKDEGFIDINFEVAPEKWSS